MVSHECASFDITTTAVDNVAAADQVTTQTFGIFRCDTCNAILDDSVIADVLRHDRRDADRDIVRSVQLATERTCLDVAAAALTGDSESGVLPAARGRTD
jgi:hypothetical protein